MIKLQKQKHSKGFVLMASLLTSTSLMILAIGLWTQASMFLRSTENTIAKAEAFHLAEAGLDYSIAQLENDRNFIGVSSQTYAKQGLSIGTYASVVETPNPNQPLIKKITATGITRDQDGLGRGRLTRTVVSYVRLYEPPSFDFAFFADKGMNISGSPSNDIDSYDSSRGIYGGSNATANATIATNGTQTGAITLNGNVTIHGDANVGPGGNISSAISLGLNTSITGLKGAAPNTKTYEEYPVPKSAVPLGDVTLDANKTMALSGTYHMTSLNLSGKASIQATGPTTIYLTGDSYIAGNGFATAGNLPKNLIIHVIGQRFLIYAGNSNLYGAIYAPKATVDVSGNGQIHGAIISSQYTQSGNGRVHFDEDLKNNSSSQKLRVDVVSWQESGKYF